MIITLEGNNGSGKDTLAQLLSKELEKWNISTHVWNLPPKTTSLGDYARFLISQDNEDKFDELQDTLREMVTQAAVLQAYINPGTGVSGFEPPLREFAKGEANIAIVTRGELSAYVHSGVEDLCASSEIAQIIKATYKKIPRSTRYYYIDAPVSLCLQRLRDDKRESILPEWKFEVLSLKYKSLIRDYFNYFKTLDGTLTPVELTRQIIVDLFVSGYIYFPICGSLASE